LFPRRPTRRGLPRSRCATPTDSTRSPPTATGETIAIVDACDNPGLVSRDNNNDVTNDPDFLASDLHKFDEAFGLPEPAGFFTKVDHNGGTFYPYKGGGNWALEEALDVEWAHAIAPGAKIVLVEADYRDDGGDNSRNDFDAVNTARNWPGVVAVSMSWGSIENSAGDAYLSETYLSTPVGHPGVTFLAATGDTGSAYISFPAVSQKVVAVGGTTLTTESDGTYDSETGWSLDSGGLGGGGGVSEWESQPSYQQNLVIHSGSAVINQNGKRAIPDVAMDADPATGVAECDTACGGVQFPWIEGAGTSLATPMWAGLVAIADQLRASKWNNTMGSLDGFTQTLPALYKIYNDPNRYAADFHDITTGNIGNYSAATGYDLVTGIGTPIANELVPDLAYSNAPDLTVAATHTGNFAQGDVGDSFTITVTNSGEVTTSGRVSLTDTLPSGLTVTGFSGTGWTVDLATLTATYSGSVAPGGSYPALTFRVDVANDAPATVTNSVTVSGGNEGQTDNDAGSDQITIAPGATPFIWDGAGADNNWTTAANWVGNAAPQAGDRLFFAGTTRTSSVNDFPAGTVFDSITFENGGFSISGNAVELNPQHGFAIDGGAGENTVSLPITLDEAATFLIESNGALSSGTNATIDTNGYVLTVENANRSENAPVSEWSGAVVGAGSLTKTGPGALTLAGANTYGGATSIEEGALILAGGDDCLPATTTVTLGDDEGDCGTLQLSNGSAQHMAGLFTDGDGVENRVVGGGTVVATLELTTSRYDGVDEYDGILGGSDANQNNIALEMDGSGTVLLTGSNTYSGGTSINSGTLEVR
jgi:uncharacterized repeat protein (TIGR01451 family)